MKGFYEREMTVLPSMCDADGLLGIPNAFALFMDLATEHAEVLGIGFRDLWPKGLFWLTARTKIRFYRRPRMVETVALRTWPETPERSRCNRDYRMERGGEVLIEGKTEWMVMNMKTGRLHPADSVFPEGLELLPDRVLPEPFLRMADDFSGAEDLGTYLVRSTDIDIGGHMNNAAYLRAMFGAFSNAELNAMKIRSVDALFRSPCFEGDTLAWQRAEAPDSLHIRAACGEKTVFLASLEFVEAE